jgi:hypothetical protein
LQLRFPPFHSQLWLPSQPALEGFAKFTLTIFVQS